MRTVDLIEKKRDGGELSTAEISYLINGYVSGEIPDYQIAALAMAINMICQKFQVLRWINIRPEALVIR